MTHIPPFPQSILKNGIASVGRPGSGKTTTTKSIVEQVSEDARVCILDTIKSDWWGITSSADGKKPGLPFTILGGAHGHLPLHSSAGHALGKLVATGQLRHSIMDMKYFEAGGVMRFFSDFAEELMRHARGVLYLVIEEAHEVAPKERAGFGHENMSIHWAKKIATAGRMQGIRLLVATQRVQSLHNAVLESCETLIAHRLSAPSAQLPIINWLKANMDKEIATEAAASLSSLPTGTAWVCSGLAGIAEKVAMPKNNTFDNTSTPEDDSALLDVKTASVDIGELRALVGTAVEEAKANDPAELKKLIAGLEQEIAALVAADGPGSTVDAEADLDALREENEAGYQRGFNAGSASAWEAVGVDTFLLAERMRRVLSDTEELHERAKNAQETGIFPPAAAPALTVSRDIIRSLPSGAPLPQSASSDSIMTGPVSRSIHSDPVPPQFASSASMNGTAGDKIEGGPKKILAAIVQCGGSAQKTRVALMAGYSVKGGSFNRYLTTCRSNGWIEKSSAPLVITTAGKKALGSYQMLPTGLALVRHWIGQLEGGPSKIFQVIVEAGKAGIDPDSCGQKTGYEAKGGSFNRYLTTLRGLELIQRGRPLRASVEFFR